MCLDTLPEGAKYLALSYTWGPQEEATQSSVPQAYQDGAASTEETSKQPQSTDPPEGRFVTTDDNVSELEKQDGIGKVLKNMPVAIQNAIALTRHLGFKYIWIDSLCIIQYNEDSWKINARLMDIVYGYASLTICAADGDGLDVGLEALYSPSGDVERYYRPATDQQVIHSYPPTSADQSNLELMLSWPSETYVACSRWNRRAWTFQERLISPRCLICVNKRVYFQCRTTTMSEDIYSDVKTAKGSAGWSVELYGAPAQTLNRLKYDPISVYKDCLRMYTSRELSYQRDVLSAFAGIGNVICQHLGRAKVDTETERALLFGLPASHFDFALLWQPQEVPERRQLVDAVFPSWSWSGWKCESGISYRRAAVAGPEINLHEWLLKHTWITYYIRDGWGSLRLVWDPLKSEYGTNCEERWKGYDTPIDGWPRSSNSLDLKVDFHGRPFNTNLPMRGRLHESNQGPQMQFEELLHPFRRKNKMLPPGSPLINSPDKPYLQFWTWWARFYVDVESEEDRFIKISADVGRGLKRYAILDRHRDFAGTILLDEEWSRTSKPDEPQEFIALSHAREFDESEYGYWNLYVEEDQDAVPWQLYNVLMIIRDDPNKKQEKKEDNVAYRRGLGKIYKNAFEHSCAHGSGEVSRKPIWKEIILG